MSKRSDRYHRATSKRTTVRARTRILKIVEEVFSHERSSGIVNVSTVPFITERWVGGERQIISFMVTLPIWLSEEKILEAINLGFGFLDKET